MCKAADVFPAEKNVHLCTKESCWKFAFPSIMRACRYSILEVLIQKNLCK